MTVPPHAHDQRRTRAARHAAHILLVEDDSALLLVLLHTLTTHLPPFKVTTVSSAEQAWGALEDRSVNFVITDLHLPGLDGPAFIRRIRERGWHHPIIVMSGYGIEAVDEVREMFQISAVLGKPFEMTSLLSAIAAARKEATSKCSEERA
jgi:DNA-binding NtrC family response regulator